MAVESRRGRELTPTQSFTADDIVTAAKAHAANIRRTLWLKQYKRANCRAFVDTGTRTRIHTPGQGRGKGATVIRVADKQANCGAFAVTAITSYGTAQEGRTSQLALGYGEPPPIMDGPIYTPSYWREWQRRSKARRGRGSSSNSGGNTARRVAQDNEESSFAKQGPEKTCRTKTSDGEQAMSSPLRPPRLSPPRGGTGSASPSARPLPRTTYSAPTSSFAGGRCGTPIFESIPGSGDVLLRAHHDAIVGDRNLLGAARISASKRQGVRLSHNDPRPKDRGHENSVGGMYDVRRADLLVMPATPSCSFGGGDVSGPDPSTPGSTTPGAIYNPNIGGSSASIPATRFSPCDRFSRRSSVFVTPGPGHYSPEEEEGSNRRAAGAVAWTGVETFMDSERSRPARPTYLRSWRGFGNGCNLDEHIGYGACLDGRCCTRHSIEKRNALRVVQFQGQSGKNRRESRRRRSDRPENGCPRSISPPRTENESVSGEPAGGGSGDGVVVAGNSRGSQSAGYSFSRDKASTGGSRDTARGLPRCPRSPSQPGKENKPAGGSVAVSSVAVSGGSVSSSGVLAGKPRGRSAGSSLSRDKAAGLSRDTAAGLARVDHFRSDTAAGLSRCHPPKSATTAVSVSRSATVGLGGVRSSHRERTPLHFASERGELSLVDRLCSQGDDRNAVDERGYTPLHDAADKGKTRVVSRLLQGEGEEDTVRSPIAKTAASAGPRQPPTDVDAQDNQGRTPLYLACLRGHERIVRALLKAGADPDLVDIRGKPAQEVAGQQKIYQLLQFKADVSLVKANISALEARNQRADCLRQDAAKAGAQNELAELKREELRLRALIVAAEKKRSAYAAATESST